MAPEDLGDAFFGEVFQRLFEVFGAHGVAQADAVEDFGREVGDAGEADVFALR